MRAALVDPPAPAGVLIDVPGAREAAVLVAMFDVDGEAAVLLTKRPETMPSHRGEIAFPGGKREPEDADLTAAAFREAREEVGIDPAAVEVVAELDRIGTVASAFTITPFVGLLPTVPELRPDPREVVEAFAVPISDLLHPDAYREETWNLWGEPPPDGILRAARRDRLGRHRADPHPPARTAHRDRAGAQPDVRRPLG